MSKASLRDNCKRLLTIEFLLKQDFSIEIEFCERLY